MRRILLIVDDMPGVCRAMSRYMRPAFDEVLSAVTPQQAEELLENPSARPTHLLIDQFLGQSGMLGTDLVAVWRRRYPSLRVAVVLSGAESVSAPEGSGVDMVLRKPPDVRALRDYFEGIPT